MSGFRFWSWLQCVLVLMLLGCCGESSRPRDTSHLETVFVDFDYQGIHCHLPLQCLSTIRYHKSSGYYLMTDKYLIDLPEGCSFSHSGGQGFGHRSPDYELHTGSENYPTKTFEEFHIGHMDGGEYRVLVKVLLPRWGGLKKDDWTNWEPNQ